MNPGSAPFNESTIRAGRKAIEDCRDDFLRQGREYTEGYLSAFRGISRAWAIFSINTRFYGAREAYSILRPQ